MKIVAREDATGIAPADCRWTAIDEDTYDGAPDSRTRGQIGFGATAQEAVADLRRVLVWHRVERRREREP